MTHHPPRKKHKVDLKRMPSSSRIASQNYHTKPSTTPRPIRRKVSSTVMKVSSSEETKVAIEALLSLGNDVIPENDITAENSALVPIGINAPPTVNDNLDTVTDNQNDVTDQPTNSASIPAPAQTPPLDCTDDDSTQANDTTESTDSQTTTPNSAPAKKEKERNFSDKKLCAAQKNMTNKNIQVRRGKV